MIISLQNSLFTSVTIFIYFRLFLLFICKLITDWGFDIYDFIMNIYNKKKKCIHIFIIKILMARSSLKAVKSKT